MALLGRLRHPNVVLVPLNAYYYARKKSTTSVGRLPRPRQLLLRCDSRGSCYFGGTGCSCEETP